MDFASLGLLATLLVALSSVCAPRAQWATDLTLSDDAHRRELCYTALDVLAGSSLAGPEDFGLLDVALTVELTRRPAVLDDGWVIGDYGDQMSGN